MNRELVEILIGIYQTDEISKSMLCSRISKCKGLVGCIICPLGYIHVNIYGDNPHYLEHLITLMDRGNI